MSAPLSFFGLPLMERGGPGEAMWLVGGQRTRETVKLCITKGQEFEGGRIERREEEKSD